MFLDVSIPDPFCLSDFEHYVASMRETLSLGFVNTKGADQFAHLNNFISSFVIH